MPKTITMRPPAHPKNFVHNESQRRIGKIKALSNKDLTAHIKKLNLHEEGMTRSLMIRVAKAFIQEQLMSALKEENNRIQADY